MSSQEPPSRQRWEHLRPIIKDLYCDQNWTLAEVRQALQNDHQFVASVKQFKLRLKEWGLAKNATREMRLKQLITLSESGKHLVENNKRRNLRRFVSRESQKARERAQLQGSSRTRSSMATERVSASDPFGPQFENNHHADDGDGVDPMSPQVALDTGAEFNYLGMDLLLHKFSLRARYFCPIQHCDHKPEGFTYRGNCEAHIKTQHSEIIAHDSDWKTKIIVKTVHSGAVSEDQSQIPPRDITIHATRLSHLISSPRASDNAHSLTDDSRPTHQYEPLDTNSHVRLFKLTRSHHTNELCCQISTHVMDEMPRYCALSYVWTSMEEQVPLLVAEGTYLKVPLTLSKFIRDLARAEPDALGSHSYWADAICINQHDQEEKGRQLQTLSKIFQQSISVIVWLNDGLFNTIAAAKFINQMDNMRDLHGYMNSTLSTREFNAFADVLDHPWFHWAKALQVLCCSRHPSFYLGDTRLRFLQFLQAFSVFRSILDIKLASAKHLDYDSMLSKSFSVLDVACEVKLPSTSSTILTTWPSTSLLRIVNSLSTESIDDQIQLLKELASDAAAFIDRLDDDSGVPVHQRFVTAYIQHSASLDIIFLPLSSTEPNCPSWIKSQRSAPLWTPNRGILTRSSHDTLSFSSAFGRLYTAAGDSKAVVRIADTALFVSGFTLAVVEDNGDLAINACIPQTWLDLAGFHSAMGPFDAFWRTLVADRAGQTRHPPLYWGKAISEIFEQASDEPWIDLEKLAALLKIPPIAMPMVNEIRRTILGCRLARTSIYKFALVPAETKVDDIIAILFGCSVPTVLRKVVHDQDKGQHHFKVIGECFMYGIMDGEALADYQERGIENEEFELW